MVVFSTLLIVIIHYFYSLMIVHVSMYGWCKSGWGS